MEQRALVALEFDKIKDRLVALAACRLGKEQVEQLTPMDSLSAADAELEAVDQALQFLYRMGSLPYGGITDVRPHLRKVAVGGTLGTTELLALANFMYGGRRVKQFIESAVETIAVPALREQGDRLFDARQTEKEIRQIVDDDGAVLDSASPELRALRSERRHLEAEARRKLEQMLRTHQKYLQDPVVAMRGDHLCLPVKVEYKNMLPGVVHDYSASGATVFMEPQSVVEAGIRVRDLLLQEEREIEKILARISQVVAAVESELSVNAEILGILDLWFAKASFAKEEACVRPALRANGTWNFRQARHPLIVRQDAVPVDLTLGEKFSMLIITGPNTGGKTVTLKTIGLLTLMAMAGCFVPARACEVGWCDNIFVDIGDEQSIEQNLSTFSSHMRHIVHLLGHATSESLLLLDELGAGTDPAEGAALATAVLDDVKERGCRVVATTHYAELKAYAYSEPAAMNASMEFDLETLRPTYRLLVGVPGRSMALAIAQRLGFPEHIAQRARSYMDTKDVRAGDWMTQLDAARQAAEVARREAEQERDAARFLREEWELKHQSADAAIRQKEHDAMAALRERLRAAEEEATRIVKELRDRQRQGSSKDHELVALRKSLENLTPQQSESRNRSAGSMSRDVPVGAWVRVRSLGQTGEVIERAAGGTELTVQLGLLRTKVNLADIELLERTAPKQESVTRKRISKDIQLQLDIRGETVEDAIFRIDKYLDDAVVNRLARVTIIHGKGTGALRDGVRRHLSVHRQVKTFAPGGPGEGGDGATIVEVRL